MFGADDLNAKPHEWINGKSAQSIARFILCLRTLMQMEHLKDSF
jgi:hypothetical protein